MIRSAVRALFVCLFFGLFFLCFSKTSFAITTSYKSATTITTDGSPAYTNLSNCNVTDGLTCDRALSLSYANLYFQNFGDFGIPNGATITHVRVRVTGKANVPSLGIYTGVSRIGSPSLYYDNCQSPSDIWTMYALNSSVIKEYNVTTPVTNGILATCFSLSNIRSRNYVFRVNRAGPSEWSANIDNFEIAFDYNVASTPTPSPSPSPSPTPTPPEPFLDLPWDYDCQQIPNEKVISECESRRKENKGKILTFEEAALEINSYFDHEYPLQSRGRDLFEPLISRDSTVTFMGYPRRSIPNDRVWYSSHDGYDYGRGAGAHNGDPIYPAAPGTAEYKYDKAGGHTILIDHHNGYQTRYYHLQDDSYFPSQVGVKKEVARSTVIGKVGSTGEHTSGSHIHMGVFFDKNYIEGGENNFIDYEPMGATDPFGWQSTDPDPWENYEFFYNGQDRTGNKSYYLWTKQIDNLNETLTANGGVFTSGRNTVTFPENATSENISLNILSAPSQKLSDLIRSIGPSVIITATGSLGNPVTSFNFPFVLAIDLAGQDLSSFITDTLSIYSSTDGVNWQKEVTNIDWQNEKATTEIDHLTQFALMAERLDTQAATTTAQLLGEEGDQGHFRSDVSVVLNAVDNEGGLGVDYILYRKGNEDWQEYLVPLQFSDEGEYSVEYYSVDNDENIEESKTIVLSIDKTPPEAEIYYSLSTKNIQFDGKDSLGSASVNQSNVGKNKKIVTKDEAGNALTILGNIFNSKNLSWLSILSLQYNNLSPVSQDRNNFLTVPIYDRKTNQLKSITQIYSVKDKNILGIVYSTVTDKTKVYTYDRKNKQIFKEELTGMHLLKLTTENGTLDYIY